MGKNRKSNQKQNFKKSNKNGNSNWRGPKKHDNWSQRNNEPQVPRVTLREDQVGITEYVRPDIEGFTAVIKSRYSDFHVNEIDVNDKILILNDLDIPKEVEDNKLDAGQLAEIRNCFKDVISEETWKKMDQLSNLSKGFGEPIQIDVKDVDKEARTRFHAFIKQVYGNRLVSSTQSIESNGVHLKFLKITRKKSKNDGKRNQWRFPAEYVHFLVHKENMDTTEVSSHMAQNLRMANSRVNFCGTKDKRAITTQKFCVKKRNPEEIVSSVRKLRNVKIGNFTFADNVLKLGDLHGNRFRIALRHINAEQSHMELALSELRGTGFINYYGLQRFGNCVGVPTYEIGVALMKADYKTACELILKPRDGDNPFMKEVRETWWKNRDSKTAFATFHSKSSIECKILYGLAKFGENDYATAIKKLPRNLLMLYPHAFQSLVFNRIASRRIKEFGLRVLPGDLVYRDKNSACDIESEIEIPSGVDDTNIDDAEEDAGDIEGDSDKDVPSVDASNTTGEEPQTESVFKRKVRALTEEDITSGEFSINDIVLPLPGYDIKYPENVLDEWYKEILEEFGLSSLALNHKVKTFKMAGAYRKLIVLPQNLTWEFRNYEKDNTQLIWSDFDILRKCKDERDALSKNEGKQRALLLDFCLPTSCYATMFLRELLKIDTSSSNQCSLETKAKENQKEFQSSENDKKRQHSLITDHPIDRNPTNKEIAQKRAFDTSELGSVNDVVEPATKTTRKDKQE